MGVQDNRLTFAVPHEVGRADRSELWSAFRRQPGVLVCHERLQTVWTERLAERVRIRILEEPWFTTWSQTWTALPVGAARCPGATNARVDRLTAPHGRQRARASGFEAEASALTTQDVIRTVDTISTRGAVPPTPSADRARHR